MSEDLSTLFRKEVELAKVEAKQEVAQIGSAAGMYAGAGVAAVLTLTLLSFALAWWIDQKLNAAVSFLIVGDDLGARRHRDDERCPQEDEGCRSPSQTKATVEEDLEWAKAQKR